MQPLLGQPPTSQGKWLSSPWSRRNTQGIWLGGSFREDLARSMGAEILFSSYWINSTHLDFTPPTTSFHHCQIPNKVKVPSLDPHPCDPSAQMTSLKDLEPDKMLSGWSSEDLHKKHNYYKSNSIFPLTYMIISGMCYSQY